MDFFKEERAVLSAIVHTLKLGFTMATSKKTKTMPHISLDGTKKLPATTPQLQTQPPLSRTLHSCLYQNGAMVPFHSLFKAPFLSSVAENIESPVTAPIFQEKNQHEFHILTSTLYDGGAMTPFHAMFEPELLQGASVGAESSLTGITSSIHSDGRSSPTQSTSSSHFSYLRSDSLPNTRRTSWATSIDLSQKEEGSQLSVDHKTVTGDPKDDREEPCVLSEFQYYSHFITAESPALHKITSEDYSSVNDLTPDTREVTDKSDTEIQYEARPEEVASEDSDLESFAQGETAALEDDMEIISACEETSCLAEDSIVGDESSIYDDGSEAFLPASPEEAAAWAHSHCPTNPDGTRIKILKDQSGREYILYHDCFHCLPKELAPEFSVDIDDEDGEGSGDDRGEDAGRGEDGDYLEVVYIPDDIEAETTADHRYYKTSEPSHSQSDGTTTMDEEWDDKIISYASPSDLCQGPWMLYKCEENEWYLGAFRNYFEEWVPMRYLKSRRPLSGRSPLRQVHSTNDLNDDEVSPIFETAVEARHTRSETPSIQGHTPTNEPAATAEMIDADTRQSATQPKSRNEDILGPCGHLVTIGTVSHEEQAIEKLSGCGTHRRNGLLADCRQTALDELRAEGSLRAGGDARAKSVTDWVRTAWPAAWGAEVRLTEADGKSCFLDSGETAVPCEYRGEKRSSSSLWDDGDV
ncbi:hypothetical protein VM1G_02454 [Cytospora mali]|uniref:Uncharacterized protein n=1 Tax=Cytospora mali TaxID=578113 RepID=A0A194VSF9_CYTMA|nr:hypothetical protein VM1G_02454 [Valsa mali]